MSRYHLRLLTTFCLLSSLGQVGQLHAQSALAAWHFDETSGSTAFAASGTVNGLLMGNASFVTGGINGNAVSMTTLGSGFVDMGNNFNFAGSSTFSIVAWVKLNPGDTIGYGIASRHKVSSNNGYFLAINDVSSFSGEVIGGGIFYQSFPNAVSPNLSLNDGNWHQLVGIHNQASAQAQLYVDGILRDTKGYNPIPVSPANFAVGGSMNSAGTAMFGVLTGQADEVSLWNQALTAGEVAYLFSNPGAVSVPEPTTWALIGLSMLSAGFVWYRHRSRQRLAAEQLFCTQGDLS